PNPRPRTPDPGGMNVRPVRGIRFNPDKVDDLSLVVAPPYDQIDSQIQARLYELHPNNVARITFGREEPGDNGARNKYQRARETFERWLADGVLIQDEEPAIYVYHQTYRIAGSEVTRQGFVALGELTDYSRKVVFPHERTLAKPKEDRLRLLQTTMGDFGLGFMLFQDPDGDALRAMASTVAGEPLAEARDLKGERHRLWRITNPRTSRSIQALMAPKRVIIADGHHRYETALSYSKSHPGAGFKLMAFFSMDAPGLTILPNHRLVHSVADFSLGRLVAQATEWFDVATLSAQPTVEAEAAALVARLSAGAAAGRIAVGLVAGGAPNGLMLTLRPEMFDKIPWPPGKPEVWKRLALSALHEGLLQPFLGITDEKLVAKTNVDYIADAAEAVRLARSEKYQAAFLLNPTTVEELRAVVEAGEVLPQKATHFYPKLLDGLVSAKVGGQ
ncbi:MAG TPA: DUF1015 domain-containing protein, partial [Methylomirabilota bacterium]|nr:DUF1015 domain-containing protein [Methylomirabilota bacterium]